MSEELRPVRCGCGGRPIIEYGEDGICRVRCSFCLTGTVYHRNKSKAVQAWNRAMSAHTDALKQAYKEGYVKAKDEEAVSRSWDETYKASQRYGYPMDMGG